MKILNIDNLKLQVDIKQKLKNLVVNLQRDIKKVSNNQEKFPNKKTVSINAFYFYGPHGSGKRQAVTAISKELKKIPFIEDMKHLLQDEDGFDKALIRTIRDALLKDSFMLIINSDLLFSGDGNNVSYRDLLLQEMRNNSLITFLIGEKRFDGVTDILSLRFPIPPHNIRREIWEDIFTGFDTNQVYSTTDDLAAKFKFTEGQIRAAVTTAMNQRYFHSNGAYTITENVLLSSCRSQSNQKLSELALKIDPKLAWSDIVLPVDQMGQLHDICGQFKHRHKVYDVWGFNRKSSLGKGLNALFSGPSGTGKTMAAEVIAKELDLDMYKIDLSQVVSKYIGETEKNLNRIFSEAETSNAILFFDEADALFGKRSEVRDAHDRYANIEVGYLLQKIEEFEGMTILATNLRRNMDEAFVRRIQFIVDFPFPDEDYRYKIWQIHFPKRVAYFTQQEYKEFVGKYDHDEKILGSHIKEKVLIIISENLVDDMNDLGNEAFNKIVKYTVKDPEAYFTQQEYQEFVEKYPCAEGILGPHREEKVLIVKSDISLGDTKELGEAFDKIERHTTKDQEAWFTQQEYQEFLEEYPHANEILGPHMREKVLIVISDNLVDDMKELGDEAFNKIIIHTVKDPEVYFTLEQYQKFFGIYPHAKEIFTRHIKAKVIIIMSVLSDIPLEEKKMLGDEAFAKIDKHIIKDSAKAKLSDDINFEDLARMFELTGGNIRNIAINAAFMAASKDGTITMKHIINAIRREYMKMGKMIVERVFGKYFKLI